MFRIRPPELSFLDTSGSHLYPLTLFLENGASQRIPRGSCGE